MQIQFGPPKIIAGCCGALGLAVLVISSIFTTDYIRGTIWSNYWNFCHGGRMAKDEDCTVFLSHMICAGIVGIMAGVIQIVSVLMAVFKSDPVYWCAIQFLPFILSLLGFILPFNALDPQKGGELTGFLRLVEESSHSNVSIPDYNIHAKEHNTFLIFQILNFLLVPLASVTVFLFFRD